MTTAVKAVFLSYAREDADAARRIAEALRSQGLEVWFDESELRGGETWDAKIRKQISDCALFVPIISRQTDDRSKGYFRLEWKLAVEQTYLLAEGVPFIAPVVIDDTRESGANVPAEFLRVQWTRLPAALPTPQLIDQIKRLLARTGGRASELLNPSPSRSEKSDARRRPLIPHWLGYMVTLAIGAVIGGFVVLRATRSPVATPVTKTAAASSAMTAAPLATAEKSVAVLAFENLSGDKENEYFSDGISEELLNVLAKVPGLRVAARTSAFYFKGKQTPIGEVAKQLNVGYVVEGSVRKVGTQVRITAQLINAADGFHLWSATFTRELKDIFALQDEIAGAIAQNLQLKMGNTPRVARPVDPEVHRLVLEAKHYVNLRTNAGLDRADSIFAQAIKLAPAYADAHAGLARTWLYRAIGVQSDGLGEATIEVQRARESSQRAIQLDPTLSDSFEAMGYLCLLEGKLSEAEQNLRKAVDLNPNSAFAHSYLAQLHTNTGRLDAALLEYEKANLLDPLDLTNLRNYAIALGWPQRFEQAWQLNERELALRGSLYIQTQGDRAKILLGLGRKSEAIAAARIVRQNPTLSPRYQTDSNCVWVLRRAGAEQEAVAFANELFARLSPDNFQRGFILTALGRFDEALPYLERTPVQPARYLFWDDRWDPFRKDPRFLQLMAKLGRAEDYKTARETLAQMLAEDRKIEDGGQRAAKSGPNPK